MTTLSVILRVDGQLIGSLILEPGSGRHDGDYRAELRMGDQKVRKYWVKGNLRDEVGWALLKRAIEEMPTGRRRK